MMPSLAVALTIGMSILVLAHGDDPVSQHSRVMKGKGHCPDVPPHGLIDECIRTIDHCWEDRHCGPGKICCPGRCGNVCLSPKEKRGTCPGVISRCVDVCSNDHHCKGIQKCCPNICGYECMDPNEVPGKIGKCPIPTRPGGCTDACSHDSQCKGRKKCCSNGCGHNCMDPES